MTTPYREVSPQKYARAGGITYLFIIVAALFAEMYARGGIIVRGDASATAANLVASETLFRVSVAGEALTWLADITVTLVLFVLLEPVSRNLSLLAAFHRIAFVAVYAASKLVLLTGAIVLNGDVFLEAFTRQQLEAISYLSLRVHSFGYGLSLLLFGAHCAIAGYLIYRSGYLPRVLGALMMIAGVCYMTHSLIQIVSPPFASKLFPWMLLPAFPAELGLALWLLVKGVNMEKWEARLCLDDVQAKHGVG